MREAAIGVDIGGTKINVGLIDKQGHILLEETVPTRAAERMVMPQVEKAVGEVWERSRRLAEPVRVIGIGVGSAGQIDFGRGVVTAATDLIPDYAGTRIREVLERACGLPVYVDNDVNVLAVAEKRLGSGQEARSFVCVALGTGVGGAIVSDGRLLRGASGAAGEIGHLSVCYDGPACMCGGIGCLELYASGTGIARLMRERLEGRARQAGRHVPEGTLAGVGDRTPGMTAQDVAAMWLAGDEVASSVMHEAISALAAALAGLTHALNPELIIVGGGVAEIGDPFFAKLREETRRRTMPWLADGTRIVPAVGGSKSGMIGAALQVWEYEEDC